MVLWLTGLSGSGKTTLADALHALLKPRFPELVMFDGDQVRAAFGDGLGHTQRERVIQVTRVQRLAKLLSDQGLKVIVALVYQDEALLAWNRGNIDDYFEIHVDCSLDTVKERDAKGLYRAFERGETKHLVGCDIPWTPPERPDFVVDGDDPADPVELAADIIRSVPQLANEDGKN
jgi:adenylylsulfate kinase-like enzyme